MRAIARALLKFARKEDGPTAVEYAVKDPKEYPSMTTVFACWAHARTMVRIASQRSSTLVGTGEIQTPS